MKSIDQALKSTSVNEATRSYTILSRSSKLIMSESESKKYNNYGKDNGVSACSL